MSLDGFIAGPNGGPENPLGDGGTLIHQWVYNQKNFRELLKVGAGGETGRDNEIITRIMKRIGAKIKGNRKVKEGEANWPEEAPFHCPVYVLTHQRRNPWERKGGTTFYFTKDPIEVVLQLAKKAAGNKDVRISGGAETIRSYLSAGLIDEFSLHVTPIIMGTGVRLFEKIKKEKFSLEISEVVNSPMVTHLFYKVINHEKN